MISRQFVVAVLLSAIAGSAAFAQAITNAPPKSTAMSPPAAAEPATTATTKAGVAATPARPPAPAATPAKPAAAPKIVQRPLVVPTALPPGAKVNLNTASAEELDKLPQIGPARAKAIVAARATARFRDWKDFVARNVVPANALAAIQNRVSF